LWNHIDPIEFLTSHTLKLLKRPWNPVLPRK
jgi:hypothetical protein